MINSMIGIKMVNGDCFDSVIREKRPDIHTGSKRGFGIGKTEKNGKEKKKKNKVVNINS